MACGGDVALVIAQKQCSGPGKLTQALAIDGRSHGADVLKTNYCSIVESGGGGPSPLACRRIGISSARELPWRYVLEGSGSLSVSPEKT